MELNWKTIKSYLVIWSAFEIFSIGNLRPISVLLLVLCKQMRIMIVIYTQ